MTALPIAVFWALAAWAALSPRPVAIYLFFATMPFGACAVIPTAMTGGLTLIATPAVAIILIAKAFMRRDGPAAFLTLAMRPDRLLFLFAFWLVVSVTTLFMPRLLAGALLVVPVRGVLSGPALLAPSMQNLSQWVYMSIAVFSVFAFARLLETASMRQHALQAMCLGAGVLILTGLLDYASQFVPMAAVLAPFRTASYALATEVEVLGSKRVVGLMPEASAFGNYGLGFLCSLHFYRRAIVNMTLRRTVCPVLLILLILFCWQSKSSATYIGVALFGMMAMLEWLLRANREGYAAPLYKHGLLGELSTLVVFLLSVTLLMLFKPTLLDPVYAMIDRMVLQKGSSHSFEQRGMWRTIALASLGESYGLGIGLGSTRSSSSIVGVLSAAGILGGVFFYLFVAQRFLGFRRNAAPETQMILSAFRFSYAPMFAVSLMIADANFDALTAFGFGISAAVAAADPRRAVKSRPYGLQAPDGNPLPA